MLVQSTQIRIPVKLVSVMGVDVTGITSADILNGSIEVIKATGATTTIAVVNSGASQNWFEVDSVQSPGLYHILLPSTATSIVGPIQVTVCPSASDFVSVIYMDTVSADSTNLDFLYQFLIGNQKIEYGTDKLTIYQSDGSTPLIEYYLTDQNSKPSVYNIFNKVKVQ